MDPALAEALASIEWPKPAEIEYRIYYDPESGTVLDYTNEQRPGHWIVTDRDTFHRHRFDVKVRDGVLVRPRPPICKLVPSHKGTACDPRDITIISHHADATHWSMKIYED